MRDDLTMQHHLSLAGHIHKMIPEINLAITGPGMLIELFETTVSGNFSHVQNILE